MIKKILSGIILLFCITGFAFSADLSIAEKAISNALSAVPSSYEFREESGALFFVQKKCYRFDIISDGGRTEALVTFSSEQNELPEQVYSLSIEVDFKGSYSSTCRVPEYRTYQTGQHGIFRYFFDTTSVFVY
ncbi:MAG: hypothetical protein JEZ04_14395 [Spirochaetales bacterium]|nr:hypothetical protein [Spirochaetales bacterium]